MFKITSIEIHETTKNEENQTSQNAFEVLESL